MYDLQTFSLADMVECGAALRRVADGASSMEEASRRVVAYFRDNLANETTGQKACALVRVFKTHPYQSLEPELQGFARKIAAQSSLPAALNCLTLLATAGDRPEWNHRTLSGGHQAIPLLSEAMVKAVPMVSQLLHQFGVDVGEVLHPSPSFLRGASGKSFNVFHVPCAVGSPHIPAQESFVIPAGVKSVLGFGGIFPSGGLFAVIMFVKVPVPAATADQFKTLALNVKLALLPYDAGRTFAS